jgi:hypothetical protein
MCPCPDFGVGPPLFTGWHELGTQALLIPNIPVGNAIVCEALTSRLAQNKVSAKKDRPNWSAKGGL